MIWCFMLKVKEQDIVRGILDYLNLRKITHAHVRNTGSIIQRGGKTFFGKARHSQPGVADILGVYRGIAIAIEVKSLVGRLRPDQEQWLMSWSKNGGAYCVARSIENVEQFLSSLEVKNGN